MKYRTAFFAILAVIAVHFLSVVVFDVYGYWKDFDIPMHFAGGFVMGMLGLAIHHGITDVHHMKKSPVWYHYLFVVSFTIFVAVAWEFHEYILDQTIVQWYGLLPTQLSLEDTLFDLLMGLTGGTFAFFVFKKQL